MQQIQLNIIPFTPVASKLKFTFFGSKIPNGASINEDEIIIRIGAFKPQDEEERFVGSVFCFGNYGVYSCTC